MGRVQNYYVYVYIDPRNNEEFYYGKGRGNRRYAHLAARGDSAKVRASMSTSWPLTDVKL